MLATEFACLNFKLIEMCLWYFISLNDIAWKVHCLKNLTM